MLCATLHKRVFDGFSGDSLDVNALYTTADGVEQLLRRFADHDEHRALRWLFQQLQQFVGACLVHAFGQPNDGHLVASLA